MENLLEISGLRVEFIIDDKRIIAVDDCDLNLRTGKTLVLAGESGSGKSITALSITRNLPAGARIISGSVKFEGSDLLKADQEALVNIRGKKISYIFQEPTVHLNPVFSIAYQIEEALILHQGMSRRQAYKEAQRLLELVNISDIKRVLSSYPHQLSGGMNQRVFIAMALACRPKLLIADEPTTSLDVSTESQILGLLMRLKKEISFQLLFITHNLSIAKKIADEVSIMYRGKIVETQATEGVFLKPQHFHTKELIAAYNKIGRIGNEVA